MSQRIATSSRLVLSSRAIALCAILVPAVLGILSFGEYMSALRAGAVQDGFGVPLDRQKSLVGSAPLLASTGVVYLAAHGDLAATLTYLTNGTWRVFDDQTELVLPRLSASSTLIVTDPTMLAGQLAGNFLGHRAGRPLPLTADHQALLYQVEPLPEVAGVTRPELPLIFDDGLTLDGYRIHANPQSNLVSVDLLWQVHRSLPAKVPTIFNHLVDAKGETLAQKDGPVYDHLDWRPGEYIVTQYTMARPKTTESYDLMVGLYDYPSMQRYRVLDPTSTDSTSVDLGKVFPPRARLASG